MKEYHGESAKKYGQTKGKEFILFPTLKRLLPPAYNNARLLDVACGNGDLSLVTREAGYKYYGLDISEEMIQIAKDLYPEGMFLVSSAVQFAESYEEKFDVVVISMLFPSLRTKEEITKTLIESKKVLQNKGIILIGLPYPCFDGYMQGGILGRKGVGPEFKGYFASGIEFTLEHEINGQKFIFEDCHWTLGDYAACIQRAGLSIQIVDECKPEETLQEKDPSFYEERNRFPSYLVLGVR